MILSVELPTAFEPLTKSNVQDKRHHGVSVLRRNLNLEETFMSILDSNSNFDSVQEMPSRAAWLDNASSSLLNDNSYFNNVSRRSDVPAWLGQVDLFDSSRATAVADDTTPGETPPVETPPVETPPVETPPVGTIPAEPEAVPAAEPVAVGPRAVAGPRTDGGVFEGKSIPGNGSPEHTGEVTDGAMSRSEAAETHQSASQSYAPPADAGPGPDGRNADGTYGAGHHPYTPASVADGSRSPEEMAAYYEKLHQQRMEEPAPYVPPKPSREAMLKALVAAVNRDKDTPVPTPTTGEVATVDPNWVPPAGSFGGLRRRGG